MSAASLRVALRPARAQDRDAVLTIERQVFGPDAWSSASVLEELTCPRRAAVVACASDGAVVGYAVTAAAGDVVDLERIAVAPGHRRTGVASALLGAVRDAGLRTGAHRMLLEVSAANTGALAFYAAAGFVEIDRRPRYYRDGTDALVLRAPLDGGPAPEARTAGTSRDEGGAR